MKHTLSLLASAAIVSIASADTLAPTSFIDTIAVGESTSVTKTVTVTPDVTDAKVDVFFLVDTTGSMSGEIDAIQTALTDIFTNTNALGDIAYGVGQYEDFPTSPWGGDTDVPWAMLQDLTTDNTAVTTGINALELGWGNDFPESNLHGLKEMSDTASWRPGSKRIVFWFGDAPAHDPDDTPGYPGPTLADTITALADKNIQVEALNSGSLDEDGEVTAILADPGIDGTLRSFGGSSATELTTIVQNALTTTFSSYTNVALDLSEVPAGLIAASTPGSYVGSFTRDTTETFEFELTFTGVTPGIYDFDVYGLVDGVRTTAAEADRITVLGDPTIPEPSMGVFAGLALLLGVLGSRRRR